MVRLYGEQNEHMTACKQFTVIAQNRINTLLKMVGLGAGFLKEY